MTYTSQVAVADNTDRQPAEAGAPAVEFAPDDLQVETRFGTYAVAPDKILRFERGLLGFPNAAGFALLDLPGDAPHAFRLLQKVDDAKVGFIVVPLEGELAGEAESDLQAVCEARHVKREDAVFLLIATLRATGDGGIDITVNRRAPVLLDGKRMTGVQVVLNDSAYEVRYKL